MHESRIKTGFLLEIVGLIGVLATQVVAAGADIRNGGAIYATHCARCHGASGRADTANARALKVRPLAGDGKLAKMAPADIGAVITSNAKHRGVGADVELPDVDLEAVARFVKELAETSR